MTHLSHKIISGRWHYRGFTLYRKRSDPSPWFIHSDWFDDPDNKALARQSFELKTQAVSFVDKLLRSRAIMRSKIVCFNCGTTGDEEDFVPLTPAELDSAHPDDYLDDDRPTHRCRCGAPAYETEDENENFYEWVGVS